MFLSYPESSRLMSESFFQNVSFEDSGGRASQGGATSTCTFVGEANRSLTHKIRFTYTSRVYNAAGSGGDNADMALQRYLSILRVYSAIRLRGNDGWSRTA